MANVWGSFLNSPIVSLEIDKFFDTIYGDVPIFCFSYICYLPTCFACRGIKLFVSSKHTYEIENQAVVKITHSLTLWWWKAVRWVGGSLSYRWTVQNIEKENQKKKLLPMFCSHLLWNILYVHSRICYCLTYLFANG